MMRELQIKLDMALHDERYEDAREISNQIEELRKYYTDFWGEDHQEEVRKYLESFENG